MVDCLRLTFLDDFGGSSTKTLLRTPGRRRNDLRSLDLPKLSLHGTAISESPRVWLHCHSHISNDFEQGNFA